MHNLKLVPECNELIYRCVSLHFVTNLKIMVYNRSLVGNLSLDGNFMF